MFILLMGCDQGADQTEANADIEADSTSENRPVKEMKKVTGIGGIFFKAEDPKMMKAWYQKNLGLKTDEYGTMFEFRLADEPEKKGYLQWSPFSKETKYFEPSKKEFMINYRVQNLDKLIELLADEGIELVGKVERTDYGNFAHIMDPEGNKIELWEPIESDFTKDYEKEHEQ